MNLALPALLVFVLLLPGLVFRSRFKRVERTSIDYSPFGEVVTQAMLWAAALHTLWLAGAYVLLDQRLNFQLLLGLMVTSPAMQAEAVQGAAARDGRIAAYFGSLLAFAYVAPLLLRAAIVHWRLDRSGSRLARFFRFTGAPWYYLLTGADFATQQDEPDLIYATAVVDAAGTAMLYRGVVDDFVVGADGQLDRLVLQNAMRRLLASDRRLPGAVAPRDSWRYMAPGTERFYPIDGDFLVLRYSEMVTLNVEYVKLSAISDSP